MRKYELNKKYGIRKLSIGIASVSLGIVALYNNPDLAQQYNIISTVKADENETTITTQYL